LLVSFFDLEDGGNSSVRNVSGLIPDCTALKAHKIIPFIICAVFFAIMMDADFCGNFKVRGHRMISARQVKAKSSLG
jgi:hypothetical protein